MHQLDVIVITYNRTDLLEKHFIQFADRHTMIALSSCLTMAEQQLMQILSNLFKNNIPIKKSNTIRFPSTAKGNGDIKTSVL